MPLLPDFSDAASDVDLTVDERAGVVGPEARRPAASGRVEGHAARGRAAGPTGRGLVAHGQTVARGRGQAAQATVRRLRKCYPSSGSEDNSDSDSDRLTAPSPRAVTSTRRRGAIVLEEPDSDEERGRRVPQRKKTKQLQCVDSIASRTRAGGRRDSVTIV